MNDLTLEIGSHEFVTLVGSNGTGKSTLMNLIAGEVHPSQGQINIAGCDVTHQMGYKRGEKVARVFQDPRLGTCGDCT